jgi:hypothetical protein
MEDMEFYEIEEISKEITSAGEGLTRNGYGIRLEWILKSAIYMIGKGEKYMNFVVMAQKGGKIGKVLDPETYKIFAEGLDDEGDVAMAEDFPKVIWP